MASLVRTGQTKSSGMASLQRILPPQEVLQWMLEQIQGQEWALEQIQGLEWDLEWIRETELAHKQEQSSV